MSIAASLLFSSALVLRPDADLRIYNPHDADAEAVLTCDGAARLVRIEPRGFADVANASACTGLDTLLPLTAFETSGTDVQRVLESDAACDASDMYAPLFGCKAGTGTAAVPVVDGATYAWSVEGASVLDGAGTPRITLAFGQAGNVKLTCIITTAACSRTASAVIGVRGPIDIAQLTVPQSADAGKPVTITWSYNASSPTSQMLAGDAFEAPVTLAGDARSYTFTPKRIGTREVELRASYFAALPDEAAPRRKRRAAGRSAASATGCAVASAERRIEVRGCSTALPIIIAPDSVDAGVEFQAHVELENGEESRWSVENGTLVGANERDGWAQIRSGSSGDVQVKVTVVRGACTRENTRSLRVNPAAGQCPVSPVARLTLVSQNCDRAVVKASFTGAPPFRGTWSDGTPFQTSQSSLEHAFIMAGTYGITGFRDASCVGVIDGAPSVTALRPRVRLSTIGGSCDNGTIVASLTGTPPFQVLWRGPNESSWVTTSESEIRRPLKAGDHGLWEAVVIDAACNGGGFESNRLTILPAPTATVDPPALCNINPFEQVGIHANVNGPGPYSVTWSDGVVTNDTDPYLVRMVPATPQEYTMVSATSGDCQAVLGNRTAKVLVRPTPRIRTDLDPLLCPGETGTATLVAPPPAGATIEWTVPGGEVLTGQGTSTITFRGTTVTDTLVRATAVYPDGACSSFDHVAVRFHGIPNVTDFAVSSPTIRAGQSTIVSFTADRNVNSMAIGVIPQGRQSDLAAMNCSNGQCRAVFKDSHGPATVTFELRYGGDCTTSYKSVFATLTIQE